MSNDKLKEFAWSSLTTFLAAFLLAIAPVVGEAPMDAAFWIALLIAGARAGVKAVMQYLLSGKIGELVGAKGRV